MITLIFWIYFFNSQPDIKVEYIEMEPMYLVSTLTSK